MPISCGSVYFRVRGNKFRTWPSLQVNSIYCCLWTLFLSPLLLKCHSKVDKQYVYMYTNAVQHYNCLSQDNFSTLTITLMVHNYIICRDSISLRYQSILGNINKSNSIAQWMNYSIKYWPHKLLQHIPVPCHFSWRLSNDIHLLTISDISRSFQQTPIVIGLTFPRSTISYKTKIFLKI